MHLSRLNAALAIALTSMLLTACGGSDGDSKAIFNTDSTKPTLDLGDSLSNIADKVSVSSVKVSGKATDAGGVKSVTYQVNNNDKQKITVATDGKFEQVINLTSGKNLLTIVATDKSGNVTTETKEIYLDDIVPSLTLEDAYSKLSGNVAVAMVTASGMASDEMGIKSLTYKVNDQDAVAITLAADGKFKQPISLMAGNNVIILTVTDATGNVTNVSKELYLGDTLAAAGAHTGALVNGKLYTWGRNNYGQSGLGFVSKLSAGDANHPTQPQLVSSAPADIVSISFNQNQSMALTKDGKVYGWGYDKYGYLGRGENARNDCSKTADCRLDIGALTIDKAVMVGAGYKHSLVLDKEGNVWAFGKNKNGQLGNGLTEDSTVPVQVDFSKADGVGKIIQVVASSSSSYAVDDKGQLWGWGRNQYGNLGQGTVCDVWKTDCVDENPLPVKIPVITDKNSTEKVEQIAVGRDHVLALTNQENVYAWGLNATSQVGYNADGYKDTANAWERTIPTPTKIPWFEGKEVREVYANGNTSFALMADGKIYPWGMYGESKADGGVSYANLNEPTDKLPNLTNVDELAIGALHQIAKTTDSNIYTWGWSFEGSLGGTNVTNRWMYNTPILLSFPK